MGPIGRDQILTMIPHQGTMCLLDEVLSWDESSVRCLSYRYRQPDNPLRRSDGTLGAMSGLDIAAQAMAVHGRLREPASARPGPGYLVSLRDVRLCSTSLDGAVAPLVIDARLLAGSHSGATYEFAVADAKATWLGGRATVLFGPGR